MPVHAPEVTPVLIFLLNPRLAFNRIICWLIVIIDMPVFGIEVLRDIVAVYLEDFTQLYLPGACIRDVRIRHEYSEVLE